MSQLLAMQQLPAAIVKHTTAFEIRQQLWKEIPAVVR
jgi:hypothetical protein